MTSTESPAGELPFVKMEGAGNDYVFVDGIRNPLPVEEAPGLAVQVADRHYGIGSDGLIVLAPSADADCRMLVWNADGSRARMCGNGLRCLAKLAYDSGHVPRTEMTVETDAGPRRVELLADASGEIHAVRADMGTVTVEREPRTARLGQRSVPYHRADAGNPHAVVFCDDEPGDDIVLAVGPAFQRLPEFAGGINVEFVQVTAEGALWQRTYERGSGETLGCGSGATVAAAAAMVTGRLRPPRVEVRLRGGVLTVHRRESSLVMEGPARTVFRGWFPFPGGDATS